MRKYQRINNITFVNEWIPELLLVLSFSCLLIALLINIRGLISVIGIIILIISIMVSLIITGTKLNDYIELVSPNGTHQVLVVNSQEGFETGVSAIYLKRDKVFKELVGHITQEKCGAVIGLLGETLEWISDDVLIVKYNYLGEDKRFEIDLKEMDIKGF